LKPLKSPKFYYYHTEDSSTTNIPDFWNLLLWKPNFTLASSLTEIVFYTASVAGFYEVKLQGFTNQKKKIYLNAIFEVK
jgi:hypothetical protein